MSFALGQGKDRAGPVLAERPHVITGIPKTGDRVAGTHRIGRIFCQAEALAGGGAAVTGERAAPVPAFRRPATAARGATRCGTGCAAGYAGFGATRRGTRVASRGSAAACSAVRRRVDLTSLTAQCEPQQACRQAPVRSDRHPTSQTQTLALHTNP
jgi:hypothetical protein